MWRLTADVVPLLFCFSLPLVIALCLQGLFRECRECTRCLLPVAYVRRLFCVYVQNVYYVNFVHIHNVGQQMSDVFAQMYAASFVYFVHVHYLQDVYYIRQLYCAHL